MFGLKCSPAGIPVFRLGFECMSVLLSSNYLSQTKQTCQWQVVSLGSGILKYTISLRMENKSENICSVKLKDVMPFNKVSTKSYEDGSHIEEYHQQFESRGHQFVIDYFCFINHYVNVLVEAVQGSNCETVTLPPVTSLQTLPSFDGPCFLFFLNMSNNFFAFDISFLNQWENAKNYKNQYSVAAYIPKNDHQSLPRNRMKLNILDKASGSSPVYSYLFTGEDLPFHWQSYGQHLTIRVNVSNTDREPGSLWIIVSAIYESQSLFGYLVKPYDATLNIDCYLQRRLSLGGKSCFSINKNFSGSWEESNKFCENQGAHLWSVKNALEWTNMMRSHQHNWYIDEAHTIPVYYDGKINAVSLLRHSSLMFLGPGIHKNKVIHDGLLYWERD